MKSRAVLLGHPIHQMLVVIPVGLLLASVVFDLIAAATDRPAMAVVSFWMLTSGLLGGLLAAPFGLIDWLGIPAGTRARRVGALHGVGNVVVLVLFGASWALRTAEGYLPWQAIALSVGAAAVGMITAWLGGELVSRLGMGVTADAGLNTPSSLRPTTSTTDTRFTGAADVSNTRPRPGRHE